MEQLASSDAQSLFGALDAFAFLAVDIVWSLDHLIVGANPAKQEQLLSLECRAADLAAKTRRSI